MKNVILVRDKHTKYGTFGRLMTPNGIQLFTIERNWLNNGARNSCIPSGVYTVSWQPSPRFGWAYRLHEVPKRAGILIHPANYASELAGCIALGKNRNNLMITSSRQAQREFENELGYKTSFLLWISWHLTSE